MLPVGFSAFELEQDGRAVARHDRAQRKQRSPADALQDVLVCLAHDVVPAPSKEA
jgi:hypothetical protein